MSKVIEAAYKAYPKMSRISEPHGVIPADNKSHYLGDANKEKREGFIKGYQQAEKDLELTWENIEAIDQIFTDVFKDGFDVITNNYYQEVLKRFKAQKGEHYDRQSTENLSKN